MDFALFTRWMPAASSGASSPLSVAFHRQLSDGRHANDYRGRPQAALVQGNAPGVHSGLAEAGPRLLDIPSEKFI
jgi:hypothetical protein